MNQVYPISEIFGPTIQGEGIYTGCKATFIRTAGCNVQCKWCDSIYSWSVENATMMTEWEILNEVKIRPSPIVIITGGEPLLHELGNLVEHLFLQTYEVHLETSATIWKDWAVNVSFISISPKRDRFDLKVLDRMTSVGRDRCLLKVVIFGEIDYAFAKELSQRYPHLPFIFQVGWPSKDNGRWLAEKVVADEDLKNINIRVLLQMHKMWWGDKRGV